MSKRNLTWLRQHTNVEDLLDDGIENNSDVTSFAISEDGFDDPPAAEPTGKLLSAPQAASDPGEGGEPDFFVAAIAVLAIGCGIALIAYPVNEIVHHANSTEHVTSGGSVLYGVVGIVFGVSLLIYSFYKARK